MVEKNIFMVMTGGWFITVSPTLLEITLKNSVYLFGSSPMLGLEANDATPNHTSAVHYGSLALLLRHIFFAKAKNCKHI